MPIDLIPEGLGHPVNRIEKNLAGPVGFWPDGTRRSLDPPRPGEGQEPAPAR